MLRKLSAIVAYTFVVVVVTVFFTHNKKEALPTAAQAVQQLEQQFRSHPEGHLAEVEAVLNATTHLESARLAHDLQQLAKMGEQLHRENQEMLRTTDTLLASMRESRGGLGCACEDTCKCTPSCDCPISIRQAKELIEEDTKLQEQNNKKRMVLKKLFGIRVETEGNTPRCNCSEKCEPQRLIPDEIHSPTIVEVNGSSLVPLPPSIDE